PLGDVDAENPALAIVVGQGDAGANTNLQNATADALGRRDRSAPTLIEHRAEHQVIDWRPAPIGLGNRGLVELAGDADCIFPADDRKHHPCSIASTASGATAAPVLRCKT